MKPEVLSNFQSAKITVNVTYALYFQCTGRPAFKALALVVV